MFVLAERSQPWWVLVIRGIAAVVFGVLTLLMPGITLIFLVSLFAAYAIIDGVAALIGTVQAAEAHRRWWPLLLEGIVSIVAGIIAIAMPGITALVLLYLVAAWAIVTGAIEVAAGLRFGAWALALAGVLSVIFGVVLVIAPGAGLLSLLWLIGSFTLVFGVLMLIHGFSLRASSPTRGTAT
jgi:uncharacterized membrane protein HdeD (DUF308 family)